MSATVYVVDDDASIRKSLQRLFHAVGHAVLTFGSADEFLQCNWRERGAGCLILDVSMPGLNGLQLQQALADTQSNLPVIFMTGHGDIPMTVTAMKAGAVDFLPKPARQAELLSAVEKAIDRHRRDEERRRDISAINERIQSLTAREREVMEMVVLGTLNKQIADKLGAAEKTIKVHRGRVMHKMQVQSVAELVRDVERARVSPKS